MTTYDPEEAARELAEKLAARSRHLTFLIGAGASCAAGLPDTAGLQNQVAQNLETSKKSQYDHLAQDLNFEELLSRLRLISEVLRDSAERVDGLSSQDAVALDRAVCAEIAKMIQAQPVVLDAHERFAAWVRQSRYDHAIEIFTTNYDLLIEKSLEYAAVPYFDGFVGSYEAQFRADLVDTTGAQTDLQPPPAWTRVWKLHGSISWKQIEAKGGMVVRSNQTKPEEALAIYPTFQKYEESRRMPFVALADRMRRSLEVPETLCLVTGYSFSDDHINQLLYDAAKFYPSSEVLALFYEEIPEGAAEAAIAIPNLTLLGSEEAVIGSVRDKWQGSKKNTLVWADEGFKLGDFSVLAQYLLRNLPRPHGEPEEVEP